MANKPKRNKECKEIEEYEVEIRLFYRYVDKKV